MRGARRRTAALASRFPRRGEPDEASFSRDVGEDASKDSRSMPNRPRYRLVSDPPTEEHERRIVAKPCLVSEERFHDAAQSLWRTVAVRHELGDELARPFVAEEFTCGRARLGHTVSMEGDDVARREPKRRACGR